MTGLLDQNSPRVVYDIRRDVAEIEQMQKASLSDGHWGLAMDNGLVCSNEWWSAIAAGKLKLKTIVGVISMKARGMKGDTLEVDIVGEREKRGWVAWNGFNPTLNGKKACVRYVDMRPKKPLPSRPNFIVPVLLQVELVD